MVEVARILEDEELMKLTGEQIQKATEETFKVPVRWGLNPKMVVITQQPLGKILRKMISTWGGWWFFANPS